jgi:hypothetical protein
VNPTLRLSAGAALQAAAADGAPSLASSARRPAAERPAVRRAKGRAGAKDSLCRWLPQSGETRWLWSAIRKG